MQVEMFSLSLLQEISAFLWKNIKKAKITRARKLYKNNVPIELIF